MTGKAKTLSLMIALRRQQSKIVVNLSRNTAGLMATHSWIQRMHCWNTCSMATFDCSSVASSEICIRRILQGWEYWIYPTLLCFINSITTQEKKTNVHNERKRDNYLSRNVHALIRGLSRNCAQIFLYTMISHSLRQDVPTLANTRPHIRREFFKRFIFKI